LQAPRTALISEPGLKSRLPWSNTRRMALCGECGRSEEAQRRCNTMLSLRRSRTLLLVGQLSIERRVRRTHRGNLGLLAHVGAQVRPPPGNERANKQARAAAPRDAHHKNGLTSATTRWRHSRHATSGMHPHRVRCRFLWKAECPQRNWRSDMRKPKTQHRKIEE
jgi:hypothetical protein